MFVDGNGLSNIQTQVHHHIAKTLEDRLRDSQEYIPEISRIAEIDGQIV